MRQPPDFFGEQELELIYIAKRLSDALEVEDLLTERSVDYHVEPDHYLGGVIFRGRRVGAFFYVGLADADRTRVILAESGRRPVDALPDAGSG